MRWLKFEAVIWGDQDPAGADENYDFNTTIELERELIGALVRNAGGETGFRLEGARWEQPTDVNRRGRVLRLNFALKTPVVDEPYTILPWATSSSSGVEGLIVIVATSPDGQSTETVGPIVAPPP